jgi:hypothetical protein
MPPLAVSEQLLAAAAPALERTHHLPGGLAWTAWTWRLPPLPA